MKTQKELLKKLQKEYPQYDVRIRMCSWGGYSIDFNKVSVAKSGKLKVLINFYETGWLKQLIKDAGFNI